MSGSEEFFYVEAGKKQDQALHSSILEDGDTVAAFRSTYDLLKELGWSEERIAEVYPQAYAQLKAR